ncbi:hypothetical protein H3C70_00815 [Patescibacteria group bacterium]|nr:hypothetical protein [Patescibacteria group bacterium]
MTDQTAQPQPTDMNVPSVAPAPAAADEAAESTSEALEDQNIFDLLGINKATDQEKELFLDELQQVIWEDFVENDVELLLTEDELKEFRKISENGEAKEDERQGQMIEFLEKLIPDLEKIMLEKALELKEELTRERITEYQDFYKNDAAKLETVNQALSLADQQQWRTAAEKLNSLQA